MVGDFENGGGEGLARTKTQRHEEGAMARSAVHNRDRLRALTQSSEELVSPNKFFFVPLYLRASSLLKRQTLS
jgi:hypothetical protein